MTSSHFGGLRHLLENKLNKPKHALARGEFTLLYSTKNEKQEEKCNEEGPMIQA
jgi:hypothetical protein